MILFGRDRDPYFPDAWIQAGRFVGKDRGRILDSAEVHSLPVRAVDEAIAFIKKHTVRKIVIGEVRRAERWTLPSPAVREAIINAVVHTDYSQRGAPIRVSLFDDRLEVENPGLLPVGLAIEDIRRGVSKLRNRVLGRVFHELGFIEQWGSGIQRMTAACTDAGLAEPMLEEVGTHFRVTLSTVRQGRPAVDEIDQTILEALSKGKGLSTREIAGRIKRSARATRTRLASLVDRELVVEIGSSPQDPMRRYFLGQRS